MKLGGNIVLDGCDNVEPATLIVLKKMVGNYARKISEKNVYDELKITVAGENNNYKLEVELARGDKHDIKTVTDKNLFFALDNVLKDFL